MPNVAAAGAVHQANDLRIKAEAGHQRKPPLAEAAQIESPRLPGGDHVGHEQPRPANAQIPCKQVLGPQRQNRDGIVGGSG